LAKGTLRYDGPDKGTRGASSVKNAVMDLRVLYFTRPTCRIYKNGQICRFENFPTILGTENTKIQVFILQTKIRTLPTCINQVKLKIGQRLSLANSKCDKKRDGFLI